MPQQRGEEVIVSSTSAGYAPASTYPVAPARVGSFAAGCGPAPAEGHSITAIAARLHVTAAAVGKPTLDLPPSDDTNRRVLAVLTCLRIRSSMR